MKRSVVFNLGRVLGIVGGVCGVIATAIILTLPMYRGVETTVTSSGESTTQTFSQTLLQAQGQLEPITLFFFAAMIGLSLAALAVSLLAPVGPRIAGLGTFTAGLFLLFGWFISGFSVGPFYLPGAIFVFLAGILMLVG